MSIIELRKIHNTMIIFDRPTLDATAALALTLCLAQRQEIWSATTFSDVAKACGLRRILRRKGHFTFQCAPHTTGQAIIQQDAIEEVRFFIARAPKDISVERWERDKAKIKALAALYRRAFTRHMGKPRALYGNAIFERDALRVRVLATDCLWLVLSNPPLLKQLGVDYFPADA